MVQKMSAVDEPEPTDSVLCGTDIDCTIVGECCQLLYLSAWILSLMSPIIVLLLIWNQYYFCSMFVIIIILTSYLPNHVLLSRRFRNFMHGAFPQYYKNCSFRWTKGSYPHSIDEIQDPNNDALPTLFCIHPHGIFCQAWAWLGSSPFTVETVFMGSNALYMSPFFRLLSRTVAYTSGCDKVSMQNNMRLQRNCALIPGGFHDASIHCLDVDRVFLKNRKGFVKYAIQYQYSLTPVFGFGEKDTFYNVQGAWSLRLWLNDFGIPGILPFGRWICPILPRNDRLHVVVGEPLKPPKLPKDGKVTREMVDEHHAIYIAKLQAMYKKYSIVYGKECELEVW